MRKAATVLVLGDPGPLRDELLLRKEVDVVWSESFADALELIDVYSVDACIVAPGFEASTGYERFRARIDDVPVMVRREAYAQTDDLSASTEPVLAFLARHTGLVFARYPRAPMQVPVTVEVFGETYELRTINLSVSGVAIEDFPEVAATPGVRVELCLELAVRPLYLLARVVRVFERDGVRLAGLSFTDLEERPRAALVEAVETSLPADPAEPRLFGDLEVPLPALRQVGQPTPRPAPVVFDAECTPSIDLHRGLSMRSVTETDNLHSQELPDWFDGLEEELTELERVAASGMEAPEWVHNVLRLRIELARARADVTGEIPMSLRDEAYRMFVGLESETAHASEDIQRQVSSLRASLLRDVLGEVQ